MQGLVQSLDGLNIRNNPLEFPPPEVLQMGTKKMLSFLRRLLQAKSEALKTGRLQNELLLATVEYEFKFYYYCGRIWHAFMVLLYLVF